MNKDVFRHAASFFRGDKAIALLVRKPFDGSYNLSFSHGEIEREQRVLREK